MLRWSSTFTRASRKIQLLNPKDAWTNTAGTSHFSLLAACIHNNLNLGLYGSDSQKQQQRPTMLRGKRNGLVWLSLYDSTREPAGSLHPCSRGTLSILDPLFFLLFLLFFKGPEPWLHSRGGVGPTCTTSMCGCPKPFPIRYTETFDDDKPSLLSSRTPSQPHATLF